VLKRLLPLLLIALLAACAPSYASDDPAAQPLPTLAPTPLPELYDLDGAENVARLFLEAWRVEDYEAMHNLTTFAARDKTPLEDFTALYEDVALDLTLEELHYAALTLTRDQPSVATLIYNLTFDTLIVGTFTDENRQLRMTLDPVDRDWRIAWTPGDIFTEMGEGGALRLERVFPRRANIYDRDGVVLADQNGRMVRVNLVRADVPDLDACLNTLATARNEDRVDVEADLARFGDTWLAEVAVLEPTLFIEYEDALVRECNAEFEAMNTRRYPLGSLAPHVVGYTGYPDEAEIPALQEQGFTGDNIVGRNGIERSWDVTLRGIPGARLSIVQGEEVTRIIADAPSTPAQSVWLTLDADLQGYVQQRIADAYAEAAEDWAPSSRGAAAIVIDVNTGAVLAMVSYPTYDANAFTPFPQIGRAAANSVIESVQENPRTPQLNRVTQGNYTSGSTMKIATTLAVVDSGVYQADERYVCIGSWNREANFVRADWLPSGHGALNVRTALAQSCNPFYYEAGYWLDDSDPYLLTDYFSRLGMGEPTGITDIAENPGLIANPDFVRDNYGLTWSFSRSVNYAIGQDIDITPLQIARLSALVANGGYHYRPQLVLRSGLVGAEPTYVMEADMMTDLNLSEAAIAVTREGMCDVAQERYGTAEFQFRNTRVASVRPCGKTGTAQAPNDAPPHAWFTAYAPMDNPQIAVAVIVENSGEGSGVAAPIVRDILDYYFFELDTTTTVFETSP
jgi:penicillin-binding protein 2